MTTAARVTAGADQLPGRYETPADDMGGGPGRGDPLRTEAGLCEAAGGACMPASAVRIHPAGGVVPAPPKSAGRRATRPPGPAAPPASTGPASPAARPASSASQAAAPAITSVTSTARAQSPESTAPS